MRELFGASSLVDDQTAASRLLRGHVDGAAVGVAAYAAFKLRLGRW